MKVWAIANQKGGVGKTTTTVTVGGLLARRGARVVMIDLDPHGSLTSYFGHDPDGVERSSYSLFEQASRGEYRLPEGLPLSTEVPNLSLIPASPALATLDRQLGTHKGMGLVIQRTLQQLAGCCDVALMDCPPVVGVLMVNALAACERLIVPVQTEFLALKGLERMMRTLAMIMRARRTEVRSVIVPTMFDRNLWASLESLQVLRRRYPEQLWQSEIPLDSQFRDASRAGMPLSLINPDAPGVVAYRRLLDELLVEDDPVLPRAAEAR